MGAGVFGAWPAWLFLTRLSFVTSALSSELVGVSCARAMTCTPEHPADHGDYFTYILEADTEDSLLGSGY